jgi:RHH-type proline utilization regulon transcriptional repressor/proline dehydrogenase/delta 1-pyrroline-5-carboxylate dehydrogenase
MSRDEAFERDVQVLGERIFELAGERVPSAFDRRWWSGKVLEWAMRSDAFKVELFRFVDVFPTLRSAEEVARHLQEYFCRPGQDVPAAFQWGLRAVSPRSPVARAAAAAVRRNVEGMAQRFIGGRGADDVLPALRELWDRDVAFTVDLLGEAALSEAECERYLRQYEGLIDRLASETAGWPEPGRRGVAEGDAASPRANVSVKVSSLYWHLDPVDFEGSVGALVERLVPLFRRARSRGVFVNLDIEQHATRAITYEAFRRTLEDPSLCDFADAGIVCQAYLRDAQAELTALGDWAARRGAPVTVRLVKGAYWDYETVRASQAGHALPVFAQKTHTDASFEACVRQLFEQRRWLRPAIGSHSVRSIAAAVVSARRLGLPDDALELQMLRGMAEPLMQAVQQLGLRLREYVPVGELVPGMAYLVRRLLENTSNESFLRASFVEHRDRAALLAAPETAPPAPAPARGGATSAEQPGPFRNEPLRDFTCAAEREAFGAAVEAADRTLGSASRKPIPLWIDGRAVVTDEVVASLDPARPHREVGRVCFAGVEEAERAVAAAHAALERWRETPVAERAGLLFRTAELMRQRRDELSALQVFEVAKPWREADGDVCEAIDFLEYYGRQMLRLAVPRRTQEVPGERNELSYEGRGVCAVIAPWNFPLAILCGMTSAALVAGNPVVVKPAEQSPVVAARLVELLHEAGAPAGVVNFVPGRGEMAGASLVSHRDVATVAFTGSLEVGLGIVGEGARAQSGQTAIKRVIAELGGKNAIIVDSDADLDEAVSGVVQSAFGYSGQKCSACSRVIVLEAAMDDFLRRLVDATDSLAIGRPADPATQVGPLVDAEQQRTVREWQRIAASEGELVVRREVPEEGYYVGPTIVTGIRPEHRLAQEEVFGPVLAVMAARDFEHALEIANGTRFALTGGLYSRSPAHIEQARRAFRVGNLYINRSCTGALVERQPFGGFRLSGVGSKAGGPDYLLQFLEPRTITENTLRRGFTP